MSVNRLLSDALERVAELEEERDVLKEENTSLQAYAFRVIAFVTRSVEKLRNIPEFKPTGDVLNRVLRLTPNIALEAHDLEQQAKGCDDGAKACSISLGGDVVVIGETELNDYANDLRNQAKALKEQGE